MRPLRRLATSPKACCAHARSSHAASGWASTCRSRARSWACCRASSHCSPPWPSSWRATPCRKPAERIARVARGACALQQHEGDAMRQLTLIASLSAAALIAACGSMMKQDNSMGFFITSANPGKGGDLGGLAGADAHCQQLASAAGAGNKTWHAYLSTDGTDGQPAVNARERIGKGPWYNAKGVLIAGNLDELHGSGN